ncbi:hypothetical protein PF005_g432 [Phytophthora fragariae]|nr:hypothetical protein PF009_g473 [Phytophthora fragariae]KAE9140983.1 hypothetical protein PF007_g437 [Phytophthora fragariae]KAE9155795.1 hypothetical protein PF006_g307 [Phytophthora fragariae]KAE9237961.1 hypothetical protein PF005_g432 [Phytophthora fragariae]KAE9330427.1 hypothetical protein PF001_g393 [Phytophthora fragariae]
MTGLIQELDALVIDLAAPFGCKLPDEADLSDDEPLSAAYGNDWVVLMDKGYQGLAEEYRAIHPKKKARGAPPLTLDELRNNDKMAHDRVIAGNLFGRLKTLWGVCSHKWEWDDKSYNMFFRACVTLTNYSVRCYPLRAKTANVSSVTKRA